MARRGFNSLVTSTPAKSKSPTRLPPNRTRAALKRYLPVYLIFAPVVLYYVLFCYMPMGGLVIAFKNYHFRRGIWGSDWAGLTHFVRFFRNGDMTRVLGNTISLSLLRVVCAFPVPILFALMLNELRSNRFKRVVQTISYLPHFVSWVVVSGLLYTIFASDGLWNQLLGMLGITSTTSLLSEARHFRILFVGTAIWKEMGWSAIIYIAALTSVDAELYEAARIDGAKRWQLLWHISLPGIRTVISTMFILSFANVLSVSFDQILVMYNAAVKDVAETIDYYIYQVGLTQINNYSYATAVGFFKSFISLVLVLITNYGAKMIDEESGLW